MYMKQLQHQNQQQQQPPSHLNPHMLAGGGAGGPTNAQNEFFKPSLPEQLYSSFNQMGVNDNSPMNAGVSKKFLYSE